jgi:RNA polymerase sigma factor (sigma-70 family)
MAAPISDLAALIARARDPAVALADRHDAFGELVRRFHDAAIASAYARLRDRALAEDAVQDAFLTAWQRLDQLRQPDAFPGWILRLVFTQCHRRLRCARLPIVAEVDARALATDPHVPDVETVHERRILQRALARLKPSDRLVLSLFYGSERSHKEIADWLGVPVTTIARRLAHAKRRLQNAAFDAMSGTLRTERDRRADTFLLELASRLRRADGSDEVGVTGLTEGLSTVRASLMPVSKAVCAYVIDDPDTHAPIAYAAAARTIFAPMYDLQLAIGDEAIRRPAADALLMQVIADLQARKAIVVRHHTSSRQKALVGFLSSRGFEIVRRTQDWRVNAPAAWPDSGPECEFRGIEALDDPLVFDQALHVVASAVEEDPAARVVLPIHPDTFRRLLRPQTSGIIAIARGTIRGLIAGAADDVMPNGCRIGLLAVAREFRGKGIATALLSRLLSERGASSVRVTASERPDLMRWLARRGFVHVADTLLLERLLRKSVRVAPERLDDYVGRYIVDAHGMEPISIERIGDLLVSKARDMRDVLVAASEDEFFTRHHYGEGRFERDSSGRVARLVFTDGDRQFVALRENDLGGGVQE